MSIIYLIDDDDDTIGFTIHTQVMPRDYEEIVLYLGGKRTLDHFLDSDQEHAYD
jgi:hypothetical protein